MPNRVRELFDVTGLAVVRRVEASGIRVNSHEEQTPEPWSVSMLTSSGGGPTSGLQLRAARSAPPPPPRPKERIRLGPPLLPERAHDPYYYPGVNDDVPTEPAPRPLWQRAAVYAAGGIVLFAAGLLLARGGSGSAPGYNAVIVTTPADADVRIDGDLVPGANPRTRAGLMNGDHELLVERAGYQSRRQVFTLADSDRRIVVDLEPLAKTPVVTDEPAAAEPSQPAAAMAATTESAGAVAFRGEREADEPEEPELDALAMSKLSKRELAKLKKKQERRERVAQRYRERKAALAEGKSTSSMPEARTSSSATSSSSSTGNVGFLKINSIPWSQVYVGRKLIGNTPILKLELKAGSHTIKLKNPDLGVSKTIRIKLKAGETVIRLEKLGK